MKLIRNLLLITLLNVFAYADDISDNKEVLKTLYEKVILKDVNSAITSATNLEKAIKSRDIKLSKNEFTNLMKAWKGVETIYILGDLNEDYIDIPRYIDTFHNLSEDITAQLDRAIKSKDEIRVALFKNSLKSINALEYVLFAKDIKNSRVNEIALAIVKKIDSHLVEIKDEYIAQEKNFLSDLKKANSITINAIIQSTYKLKEWRIGDIIGLTKKYEEKPDNSRAEYYISKKSSVAIEAILNTYKKIFDNNNYKDYGDYLLEITDGEQIKNLREAINKALKYVKEIKNDDIVKAEDLYNQVDEIHIIMFLEIVEELSINAKIIEADGD